MKQPIKRVSNLVERIYEAAFDETLWEGALKEVSDLFHGSRACIVQIDHKGCGVIGSYRDELFESINWELPGMEVVTAAAQAARPGQTYIQSRIMDPAHFKKTQVWNDLFRPRGMDDSIGCHMLAANGAICNFDIARSSRQGGFTSDDVALFDLLKPHLIRANQIGGALQPNVTNRRLRPRRPLGVVVVGQDQQIYLRNDEADDMFVRPDIPLTQQDGCLAAARALEGGQLRRMLASACGINADLNASAGGIALFQPDNRYPEGPRLMVCVTPMPRSIVGEGRAAGLAAVVFRETWREISVALDNRRAIRVEPDMVEGNKGAVSEACAAQDETERALTLAAARSYLHGVFRDAPEGRALLQSA